MAGGACFAAAGISPAAAQHLRNAANPRQIPRNHAVEATLDAAEAGDSEPFFHALTILRRPFEPAEDNRFSATPSEGDQVFTTFCGTRGSRQVVPRG